MEQLKLTKSIELSNSKTIDTLNFDFESMSVADFRQIKKLESMISDSMSVDVTNMAKPKSLSFEFQLASGFVAAIKGTDGLQIEDFTKVPMSDALSIARIASFFWLNVD